MRKIIALTAPGAVFVCNMAQDRTCLGINAPLDQGETLRALQCSICCWALPKVSLATKLLFMLQQITVGSGLAGKCPTNQGTRLRLSPANSPTRTVFSMRHYNYGTSLGAVGNSPFPSLYSWGMDFGIKGSDYPLYGKQIGGTRGVDDK